MTLVRDAANKAPSSSPPCLMSGAGIGDLRKGRWPEWLLKTQDQLYFCLAHFPQSLLKLLRLWESREEFREQWAVATSRAFVKH